MQDNSQQPFTNYPPPPPPEQPLRKKRGPLFWILAIIGVLVLCGACGITITAVSHSSTTSDVTTQPDTSTDTPTTTQSATDTPVATATPEPTQAPAKWTTTHTFTGNGTKKTAVFSVPDDWKILWKCNPTSFDNLNYNVIVTVYNSDSTYADGAINATCSKKNTHDETEEHQSGDVYLDVDSEGDWTITIQEMK